MRISIPGNDITIRLFERVETVDSQYDIFDVGVEQSDGSIDSMVVGGSFSYAKSLVEAANKRNAKKKAKAEKKAARSKNAPAAA